MTQKYKELCKNINSGQTITRNENHNNNENLILSQCHQLIFKAK